MSDKKPTLREWLDEISKLCPITATLEGGNDSGSIDISYGDSSNAPIIDPDDYQAKLYNLVYDRLEYGSFAGEFWVNGSFEYDPSTGEFQGTGSESTTESGTIKLEGHPIEVRVPKDLWFDTIEIGTDCYHDEMEDSLRLEILVKDGPVSEDHVTYQEKLRDKMGEAVYNKLAGVGKDLEYCYNEWSLNRSDFKEDGDMLLATIDGIDYSFNQSDDKAWTIDCND